MFADNLKLKLLTIANSGTVGLCGMEATQNFISQEFKWFGIIQDTREFVNSCLLCLMSKSGNKMPRTLSTTLHSTKPNDPQHFYYLFLGLSTSKDKYIMVIKDDPAVIAG